MQRASTIERIEAWVPPAIQRWFYRDAIRASAAASIEERIQAQLKLHGNVSKGVFRDRSVGEVARELGLSLPLELVHVDVRRHGVPRLLSLARAEFVVVGSDANS